MRGIGNFKTLIAGVASSQPKETTFERADYTLQLSMFVTAEKERQMFKIFFLSSFGQLLSFKLWQAECVQTMKALANRPRSQLFLM